MAWAAAGGRRTLAWLGRRGHRGGALGAAVGRHLLAEPLEALSAVLLEEWEAAGDVVRLEQPDAAASKRAGSNPSSWQVLTITVNITVTLMS